MIPVFIIVSASVIFFVLEHVLPGRELPEVPGWYARAASLGLCQLGIVLLASVAWNRWLESWSLLHIAAAMPPFAQGASGWFVGTFFFYWWHRARHDVGFLWKLCHQIHHSPSRIEAITSFYKHPVEILLDSILSSLILFTLLGSSAKGAMWFNVFAVVGEYFYHSNIRTPRWLGFFIQRPEQHSIHHEIDVHAFNYGDITWWDHLFGTFREADDFVAACGFPDGHEKNLDCMLLFHDNY